MMNETKIVEAVRGGDADSYALLVNRYQTGLIIHCENMLKSREEAEDVAQDAFITAYKKLDTFNPDEARFSTWLYKIATNKCIDILRKTKKTIELDAEKLSEQTMPVNLEEDEKLAIKNAVEQLEPPKFGEIIRSYYWQGKSYNELAKEYDTTVGTIGTWMRRAKLQLRKELSL